MSQCFGSFSITGRVSVESPYILSLVGVTIDGFWIG
jgi:hypothetical protein